MTVRVHAQQAYEPPRQWSFGIIALTLAIWALHVLLTYLRVGLTSSVPLYLIWPRVLTAALANLCVCLALVPLLTKARSSTPVSLACTIAGVSVAGGLLGGLFVAAYAFATNDNAPYSIGAQFLSAAIYWMCIYHAWACHIRPASPRHASNRGQ